MKKIAFLGFVLALGTASVLTSCSKYEEGSKFTLLSKKNRLTNDWKLTAVADSNGTSLDMSGLSSTMSLADDGTFTGNANLTLFGQPVYNYDFTGNWEFTDEKETLTLSTLTIDGLTLTSPEVSKTTIVRLAKDELKVRDEETKQVSTYIPQ
jgi:hypothetical protein